MPWPVLKSEKKFTNKLIIWPTLYLRACLKVEKWLCYSQFILELVPTIIHVFAPYFNIVLDDCNHFTFFTTPYNFLDHCKAREDEAEPSPFEKQFQSTNSITFTIFKGGRAANFVAYEARLKTPDMYLLWSVTETILKCDDENLGGQSN